jgi:UDP-N-acetylmuramate--alanine ligase
LFFSFFMSIVFVWAGGSGVSALVELMIDLRIPDIVCIDASASAHMDKFRAAWCTTYVGHGAYTVREWDLLIYSAATANSPEVISAFQHTFEDHLNPPPLLYAEFLWELSKYLFTFAIAGTHGKSTTTGMSASACIEHIPETALAIVGAWVTQRQGKHCRHHPAHTQELHDIVMRIISRKATEPLLPVKKLLFVIEADEFNHHFLFLEPDVSIITSLDHDHVDIYPTRDSYLAAFHQFCSNTREQIFTLPSIAEELSDHTPKTITPPITHFEFVHLIWGHNHANASLALAAALFVAEHFSSPVSWFQASIEQFQWLQRRAERLGENTHGVPVFSDYGHHPDEIKSTLAAFRERYPSTQVTCFFEAHQARRLLTFRDEFIDAFSGVRCFVVPAYTARESLPDIQAYRKELPSTWSLPEHIEDFTTLIAQFAEQINGKTISEWLALPAALDGIEQWSILCFSAGILDSKLRTYIAR